MAPVTAITGVTTSASCDGSGPLNQAMHRNAEQASHIHHCRYVHRETRYMAATRLLPRCTRGPMRSTVMPVLLQAGNAGNGTYPLSAVSVKGQQSLASLIDELRCLVVLLAHGVGGTTVQERGHPIPTGGAVRVLDP